METLLKIGIAIDVAAMVAIVLFMPVANYFIRKYDEEMKNEVELEKWFRSRI